MEKLILERRGNSVYFHGARLTIVKQETKGPGKEVVSIDGLIGSNGRKWIMLSKLTEGINELDLSAPIERKSYSHKDYILTAEEENLINDYQNKINEIIENAKKRYIPKMEIDPSKMTNEELIELIGKLQGIIDNK